MITILLVFAVLMPARLAPATPPQSTLQLPQRDAAVVSTGTARISGVVLADETPPRPLRRARVTLWTIDAPKGRLALTDDRGRFSFEALPATRFNLSASKEAYITTAFGAMRPGRPGTSISLAESQHLSDVVIRLARGAVISGTVVDQNGQPAAGISVRSMRWGFVNGQRSLGPGPGATTDDRGEYRIFGLLPGEHVIAVASRTGPLGSADMRITSEADVSRALRELAGESAGAARQDEQRTASYAPVYYPSTTVPSDASLVILRPGEERAGIDVQLQLVPSVRVEGTIVTRDGQPPPPAAVTLIASGQPTDGAGLVMMDSLRLARTLADGRFSLASVPAGQYVVTARATPRPAAGGVPTGAERPSTLYALMPLAVGPDGVFNITLELVEGAAISGKVRFDTGGSEAPPPFKGVRVSLTSVHGQADISLPPPPSQVEADGAFTLAGIAPGRYRLLASVPPALASRWVLKGATVAGQDLTDRPFDIGVQNVAGVEVAFTDRVSQVSGAVTASSGQPALDCYVIVFPVDPSLRLAQSRRVVGVRPAHDGKYTVRVPPGEYLLTALVDVEPGEWQDGLFLERLAAGALRFTLGDGEQKIQDLRLGGS